VFKRKLRFSFTFLRYILNKVIHINDYYAPVLGELELLVLLAVLRLGNGTYGAEIRREIAERTTRDVPVSSIYVTLERLKRKKMVVSYVGAPTPERGGRRRTHYLLDTEGQKALGRSYRTLRSMTDGVVTQLENF
jgi:DNA-binding PadR family transcriptional regulator